MAKRALLALLAALYGALFRSASVFAMALAMQRPITFGNWKVLSIAALVVGIGAWLANRPNRKLTTFVLLSSALSLLLSQAYIYGVTAAMNAQVFGYLQTLDYVTTAIQWTLVCALSSFCAFRTLEALASRAQIDPS